MRAQMRAIPPSFTQRALAIHLVTRILTWPCNTPHLTSTALRAFQLAQTIDYRLGQTGGVGKCDPRLELAILFFFQV